MREVDDDEVHHKAPHVLDGVGQGGRGGRLQDEAGGHRQGSRQRPRGGGGHLRDVGDGHGHARQVSVRQQGVVGVRGRREGGQGGPPHVRSGPLQAEAGLFALVGGEAAHVDRQGVRPASEADAGGRAHLPPGHEVQAGGHGVPSEDGPQRHDRDGRGARHLPHGEVLRPLHNNEERVNSDHRGPQDGHRRGPHQEGLRGRVLRRDRQGGRDLRPPQEVHKDG